MSVTSTLARKVEVTEFDKNTKWFRFTITYGPILSLRGNRLLIFQKEKKILNLISIDLVVAGINFDFRFASGDCRPHHEDQDGLPVGIRVHPEP